MPTTTTTPPPTRSPWGTVQSATAYGPFWSVSTAGHGGVKVPRALNAKIDASVRRKGGWYEEDIDWAIVAATFPEHFDEKTRESALSTLRNWHADFYEKLTGEKLTPANSRQRAEEAFEKETADKWVVISACGDWKTGVPKGMVEVFATLGGKRTSADHQAGRTFLVTAEEYDKRTSFGFVVDESRHQEVRSG